MSLDHIARHLVRIVLEADRNRKSRDAQGRKDARQNVSREGALTVNVLERIKSAPPATGPTRLLTVVRTNDGGSDE